MKVHLIFAPPLCSSSLEVFGENTWPPMGILYIAGYLREKMPDVKISVTDGCKIGYQRTIKEVEEIKADIVGISFYTTQTLGMVKLAKEIRSKLPDVFIVVGGPHATALPIDTLIQSQANICVVGEGEEVFYNIVSSIKEKKDKQIFRTLPGVVFLEKNEHSSGKIYENKPADFIKTLDLIPFPARDMVDMRNYRGWFISKKIPQATMLFARGCPFQCTYCANSIWRTSAPRLRVRTPDNVVKEMAFLKDEYGINEVYDQADEFNHSLPHALDLSNAINKSGLNMSWQASIRAKPMSYELAKAMAQSGCWCVSMGIESANAETLDGIKKCITLEDVEKACKILRGNGIKVRAHFMFYNVWEKDGKLVFEDSQKSVNTILYAETLYKKRLVNYITWSATIPYPGSELYDVAVRYDLIKDACRNKWDGWLQDGNFIMKLPNISEAECKKIKNKGELLRIKCMLTNRDYKFKDMPIILKRGIGVIRSLFN